MAFQTVFKRYELKYVLTLEQKEKVLEAMSPYMELDTYGRSAIRRRGVSGFRRPFRFMKSPRTVLRTESFRKGTFCSRCR